MQIFLLLKCLLLLFFVLSRNFSFYCVSYRDILKILGSYGIRFLVKNVCVPLPVKFLHFLKRSLFKFLLVEKISSIIFICSRFLFRYLFPRFVMKIELIIFKLRGKKSTAKANNLFTEIFYNVSFYNLILFCENLAYFNNERMQEATLNFHTQA